ncbi:MAG TPA: nucleotidyltransferase family protein [Holophagaceae bacterium]|nr:nucleotidyltransferase family protein [Holophagaceae bacterium]
MRIAALVLAAGASRRLGRPKQLVELRSEPLLRRSARIALEAGCDPVLPVLGFEAAAMERALAGLAVRAIVNSRWMEGMSSSIRCGISSLPADADAVLLVACDQWALEAADLGRLLEAFRAAPSRMAAAAYGGGHGIPAVFPSSSFADLIALKGDRGARYLLQPEVSLVEMPSARLDLDVPEDLESMQQQ